MRWKSVSVNMKGSKPGDAASEICETIRDATNMDVGRAARRTSRPDRRGRRRSISWRSRLAPMARRSPSPIQRAPHFCRAISPSPRRPGNSIRRRPSSTSSSPATDRKYYWKRTAYGIRRVPTPIIRPGARLSSILSTCAARIFSTMTSTSDVIGRGSFVRYSTSPSRRAMPR